MLARQSEADLVAALTDQLRREGALDDAQIARAARVSAETGERRDRIFCRLGMVEETRIADILAHMLSLPRADPASFPSEAVEAEALSVRFLKAAAVLPLSSDAGAVHVALGDPLDEETPKAIALRLNKTVHCAVAAPTEIDAALDRIHAVAPPQGGTEDSEDTATDIARLKDQASDAPVVRIVNGLIRQAVEARASDIHIEPLDQRLRVRLRLDGRLVEVDPPPGDMRAAIVSRLKIMANLDIAEHRLPQDGRLKVTVAGREVDMRMATTPTLSGEGVVLRLLDRAGLVLDFDRLGFDDKALAAFLPLIERPNGILLVTGPTGSGKTTTLYAALNHLNTPERKIITIEDPVEYQLPGVTQIQVRPRIGFGFAEGLRSILRQDPDVIMVGEIRDAETAKIAVQAALTGHLVLATLHANSAAAAANRLRDMGVEDYLIAATLVGAVAQRLIRRLCPDCAAPEDPALVERLANAPGDWRRATGCAACRNAGYRGRMAVMEVMAAAAPIRQAILDRADVQTLEAAAVAAGMRPMRDHGIRLAATGQTTLTEALSAVADV